MTGNNNYIGRTEEQILLSSVIGKNQPIREEWSVMEHGQYMIIDNNTVMHNKHLVFTADIDGKLSGTVRMGHGRDCYSAAHLDVTDTHLRIFHFYSGLEQSAEIEHGLEIRDFLTVNIDVSYSRANITVMTSTAMFVWENVGWVGRQGQIFATVENETIRNVKIRWFADDYRKSIYLFGDSYFNTRDPSRWPHYLLRDGYMNNFMTGYPGMACERALVDFKLSIERGTPRYAVWCMGMNNGDKEGKINESYLENTSEFLRICRACDIIPILSTIPSTPLIDNSYKNAWVRDQGCRYIDFARAVGGATYDPENLSKSYILPSGSETKNLTGYEWYPDMLYKDLVHPAQKGAQALYMQVLVDFPEIMQK